MSAGRVLVDTIFDRHANSDADSHVLSASQGTVLLVEGDPETAREASRHLRRAGFVVDTARGGAEAMAKAAERFDFLILDPSLPDGTGLDVVRAVHERAPDTRILIVSASLTVAVLLEAVRLGVVEVLEKPVTSDALIAVLRAPRRRRDECASAAVAPTGEPRWALPSIYGPPKSAVHRWATLAIKACHADHDLKTLSTWAAAAGLSYSSLCEACRIVGIQPQEARDFVRALRALVWASIERCHPQLLLDISDLRTLKAFVGRAGPGFQDQCGSVQEFVRGQHFIPADNGAVRMLLASFVEAGREPRIPVAQEPPRRLAAS